MREQEDLAHNSAMIADGGFLSPATMAKITSDFILALEPELVLRPLCGTDTELERGGGDTKRFRKLSQISESEITQMPTGGSEASTAGDVSSEAAETYADAAPLWWSLKDKITYQSIKNADYNAVNLIKTAMTKAWARFVDKKVRNSLLAVKAVTGETHVLTGSGSPETVSLTNPNIYKINTCTVGSGTITIVSVDYVSGKIRVNASAAGPTMTIGYDCNNATIRASPLVVNAATKAKLGLADLLNAKIKIQAYNGKPTVAICYDEEVGDLLADNNVIANMAYDYKALYNGSVQKLYGLEIL